MKSINYGRVVTGGLIAGVVLTIGELILNRLILPGSWEALMERFAIEPPGAGVILWYVILMFVLGIALVWLYAAIRPRFGQGPRTAVTAGLFVWLVAWLVGLGSMAFSGIFSAWLVMVVLIWGLVEVPLAALAGAWHYRENDA